MKQLMIIGVLSSSLLFTGCDLLKKENEAKENDAESKLLQDWSCTAPANLEQIQNHLRDEYIKELDKRLRHSSYVADLSLLEKIKKGIKFEIKGVTTLTPDDDKNGKDLKCTSQLIIHLPKGLQQRAENAFLERPCEECDHEYNNNNYTLHDALESDDYIFKNDQLLSDLRYAITKTDKDGLYLSVSNQIAVIEGIVSVSQYAAEYEAYVKENKQDKERIKQHEQEHMEQTELAQKAMDIRNKELESEKTSLVESLNQAWDSLADEQRIEIKQAQADWFEKRDVDCKVLAQKSVYSLSDNEKETYQKQYQYWNDQMKQQNERMQYIKCFNAETKKRISYLEELVQ
ncbi:hypothetical protein [Acinetobacter equi]|uniref:Lysozyme inhibitor LprI N-terminal domain-containing protein n=1 Tax=Acinetobacter equi TaxID=1324350 RepID=A0A0N9VFS7_9GAMM|nr:hypothetical protein [Acinetobacter equi]ALH96409.1 hypothetical protein AOY20_13150 [Acinetobacter equi]